MSLVPPVRRLAVGQVAQTQLLRVYGFGRIDQVRIWGENENLDQPVRVKQDLAVVAGRVQRQGMSVKVDVVHRDAAGSDPLAASLRPTVAGSTARTDEIAGG